MATILLANQWGGGAGHARKLRRIADGLAERGHHSIIAVPDLLNAAPILSDSGYRVLQGPVLRGRLLPRRPSASFADIMANQGFSDPQVLGAMADGWLALLDSLQPDLLVADYAPLLCLAARDRLPFVVIGVPFCLPPGGMPEFPVLNDRAKPQLPETALLANVNRWLARRQVQALPSLPAVHPAEDSFCFGVPELDPYRDQERVHPVVPLLPVTDTPLAAPTPGERTAVFAYLSARHKPGLDLLLGLAERGLLVEACLRDFNRGVARRLARAGVLVHERHTNLHEALGRSHFYIHHGSEGAAVDGLFLGRPQLCLPIDLEKQLISAALEEMGVAEVVQGKSLPENAVDRTVLLCADREKRHRAQAVAHDYCDRDWREGRGVLLDAIEARLATH